ncbi:DUF1134 domain-containing protein [Sphingorhabdus sp. Alg239-R122]|uniref:DUF1134 domain-containing protein n=1 Tax=Sphingorhabdus sp. Alg239-R122 TaxID=2305989 RepID=UPI0013DB9E12|nr:DUF1134 domain-containing protein [Sphingorhabdus sp. Alg239-R122]
MKKNVLGTVLGIFAGLSLTIGSATAQVETVDPNDAIDADLATQAETAAPPATEEAGIPYEENVTVEPTEETTASEDVTTDADNGVPADPSDPSQQAEDNATYQKDDLIGAAEGVFGKGAEGLAMMIEDILKKQGEPNGYIVGREAGGAFIVGLRYGSGTLFHKIEGERKVYWTGPSLGLDAGANAANSFTLVYNLYDSEDLYKRFGAGEGAAYLVGGFTASYLRRGDVVLIPVRLGVGVRLGANVGYRKFSKKQRWLPF